MNVWFVERLGCFYDRGHGGTTISVNNPPLDFLKEASHG